MFLTIFVTIICVLLLLYQKRRKSTIPGPVGLPILGYYPFLGENAVVSLQQLADKYGEIFKVNLLNEDYYFLNSLETVREALVKKADLFMSRPVNEFNMITAFYGKKAYIHTEDDIYKIQRKFFNLRLSSVGMGKSDFEVRIHELCEDLIKELEKRQTITNLGELLSHVASNVIMKLVFDEKYEINDPIYRNLIRNSHSMEKTLLYLNMLLVGKVFYWRCRLYFIFWKYFKKARQHVFQFMLERVQKRAINNEYSFTTQYNDLLDYCLEQTNGPNRECFDHKTLAGIFVLFLIAGTETTAATAFHGITLLAKHPEIQRKVFKELEVYDKDSRIWYNEVDNLHYTKACVAEIFRYSCVVPLNLIHVNSEAATIKNHHIPKGSKIVANLWKLSKDKKHFKNANKFDPNNFLDENEKFIANEASIPFGTGKRKCIGFKLAEIEVVILITKLVRYFEWCAPEGESVRYEVNEGGLRILSPNTLVAKPRL